MQIHHRSLIGARCAAIACLALLPFSPAGSSSPAPAPPTGEVPPLHLQYLDRSNNQWLGTPAEIVLDENDNNTIELRVTGDSTQYGTWLRLQGWFWIDSETEEGQDWFDEHGSSYHAIFDLPDPVTFAQMGLDEHDYSLQPTVLVSEEMFLATIEEVREDSDPQSVVDVMTPFFRPTAFGGSNQDLEPMYFRQENNETWAWWAPVMSDKDRNERELNVMALAEQLILRQAELMNFTLPQGFQDSEAYSDLFVSAPRVTLQASGIQGYDIIASQFPLGDSPAMAEPLGVWNMPTNAKVQGSWTVTCQLIGTAATGKWSDWLGAPLAIVGYNVTPGQPVTVPLVGGFAGSVVTVQRQGSFMTRELLASHGGSGETSIMFPSDIQSGTWILVETENTLHGLTWTPIGNERFRFYVP